MDRLDSTPPQPARIVATLLAAAGDDPDDNEHDATPEDAR